MTKKSLWGQKRSSSSTPATHTFFKSYSQTSKRARAFQKMGRVSWRECSKVETIYLQYKFSTFLYRNFPWNLEAIAPEKMQQDNHLIASQRMSQVIHWFHLEKKTYLTPSHTNNVTWPAGMTENFPVDPSMHQSVSYLHWHIPVNESCKYRVIFILPRKKTKGGQNTFGQGYRECPCQSWILEASSPFISSSSKPSCFLITFSKIKSKR